MRDSVITIRYLAWACAGFAVGIVLSPLSVNVLFAIEACLLVLFVMAMLAKKSLHKLRVGIFAIFLVAGVLYSSAYSQALVQPVLELDGQSIEATATAKDMLRDQNGYKTLLVKFSLPDDISFTARLYDFDGTLPEVKPGDELTGEFSLKRADIMHGDKYTGYVSAGILMLAYPQGEWEITAQDNVLYFPRRIENFIERMTDTLFPEDVRAFEKALLTGEKGDLYKDAALNRAISHSGLAHVVAVSGMHVSFIVGLIMLSASRKRAFFVGVPTVIVFMLMTGMTPSVVRAGIMYIAVLSAPMMRRGNDAITMLFFALALILLQNPMAIYSISLQLSFSAMVGIFIFSGRISKSLSARVGKHVKSGRAKAVLRSVIRVCAMTIGATIVTAPLVSLYFGYFSTYSILTNLLTYFVISCVFSLGYLACVIGAVFLPLGKALAAVITVGIRYVLWCVRTVAALPGCVIYTQNPIYLKWLIFVVLLFTVAYLTRGKRGFKAAFPSCLAIIALYFCVVTVNLSASSLQERVAVMDVGQGESVIMLASERAVVIDCGGKGTLENAGDTVSQYLLSRGVKKLDALVLTHFHSDHANGATTLMECMDVKMLIIGRDLDDSDELLEEILETARKTGTEICYVDSDMKLVYDDLSLDIFAPLSEESANEQGLIIHGSIRHFDVVVTGDVGIKTEQEFVRTKKPCEVELLVIGHHGSKNSTSYTLMKTLRPDYSVVSVGYNSYGHPTDEALYRATKYGADLYSTQIHGNVIFYIGANDG